MDFSWKAETNPLGSDHFPIILETVNPIPCVRTRTPRWITEKADWRKFAELATIPEHAFSDLSVDDATEAITALILNAANRCIPKTSDRFPILPKPWWNDDCAKARAAQNKAWTIFSRYPTTTNLIAFKKAKATRRRITRESKKNSWNKSKESITPKTKSRVVRNRVRKMSGKYTNQQLYILKVNGKEVSNLEEQADLFGAVFAEISSSNYCTTEFLKYKRVQEKRKLHIKSDHSASYNKSFTYIELERAVEGSKDTAVGPDNIHYSMICNLKPE